MKRRVLHRFASIARAALVVVTGLVVASAAACGPDPIEPPPADPDALTYARVQPILASKCANCHRPDAIGPMSLLRYDEVLLFADAIRSSVVNGTMPPWPAVDGCNSYRNDLRLSDDERATLLAWLDAGAPPGDDVDSLDAAVPPRSNVRPDVVLATASDGYSPQQDDEYRCYAVAMPPQDAGTQLYITGFDIVPGVPTNVHHVNVFMNPPRNDSPDWLGVDEADPLPGYDCSVERTLASFLVGSWAPGATGLRYPEGSGQLVEPGSVMVLEVHYARADTVPDLTQIVLQTAPSVQRRGLGVAFWKFNDWEQGGMPIAAGAPDVTYSVDFDPGLILAVIAPWMQSRSLEFAIAGLHMHQLGAAGDVGVVSPAGDTCMVRVDDWDFRWQYGYEMTTSTPFFVGEDKLHLRCSFDNSDAHQPLIDGTRAAPVDRNWGHRTVDEMCMGFLYVLEQQAP